MTPALPRSAAMIAVAAAVGLAACSEARTAPAPASAHLIDRARVSMGSEVRLTAWTTDDAAAVAAFEAAFDEFDRLDRLMSVWKDNSEILQLNQAAGSHPVPLSDDVRSVLRTSLQIGDWTGGKFDVTFAALADLWKFDHDQDNRVPASADIARRLPLVDYTALVLDDRAGTGFITRAGMRAHLGGIGKGFAVDRAVRLLRSRGFTDFMVQTGGDMYVAGRRGDRPWRVAIRDPRGAADSAFAALSLTDAAISTSGDYERFFIKDGRRYHHILDPDSGVPAGLARSVTIVAPRSVFADALATGVFVMGGPEGLKLVDRLEGVEAVVVTSSNDLLVTAGLRGRLEVRAPPTDAP